MRLKRTNRFLIIGLPRSGTTYLMTLLNSHPDVYCSGEQFNPYAIVGLGDDARSDRGAIVQRDRDPVRHFEAFFARNRSRADCVGLKYMIGHTATILDHLSATPDIKILHVHRENRLAQAASYAKAIKTKIWAQSRDQEFSRAKLGISPHYFKQLIDEAKTQDKLFQHFVRQLPNPILSIEYVGMFAGEFHGCVCDFLGIHRHPGLRSNLGKQGNDSIIDRFENRDEIASYFSAIGHESWLGPEIGTRRARFEDPVL